jgi:hypothetical protein
MTQRLTKGTRVVFIDLIAGKYGGCLVSHPIQDADALFAGLQLWA